MPLLLDGVDPSLFSPFSPFFHLVPTPDDVSGGRSSNRYEGLSSTPSSFFRPPSGSFSKLLLVPLFVTSLTFLRPTRCFPPFRHSPFPTSGRYPNLFPPFPLPPLVSGFFFFFLLKLYSRLRFFPFFYEKDNNWIWTPPWDVPSYRPTPWAPPLPAFFLDSFTRFDVWLINEMIFAHDVQWFYPDPLVFFFLPVLLC